MICATLGIDIMHNASSVIITTRAPKNQQDLPEAA